MLWAAAAAAADKWTTVEKRKKDKLRREEKGREEGMEDGDTCHDHVNGAYVVLVVVAFSGPVLHIQYASREKRRERPTHRQDRRQGETGTYRRVRDMERTTRTRTRTLTSTDDREISRQTIQRRRRRPP